MPDKLPYRCPAVKGGFITGGDNGKACVREVGAQLEDGKDWLNGAG